MDSARYLELMSMDVPELLADIQAQIRLMTYTNLILSKQITETEYLQTDVVKKVLSMLDEEILKRKAFLMGKDS